MGPDDKPPAYGSAPYGPPMPHSPYGQIAQRGEPQVPYGYQQNAAYPPPPSVYQEHIPHLIGTMPLPG